MIECEYDIKVKCKKPAYCFYKGIGWKEDTPYCKEHFILMSSPDWNGAIGTSFVQHLIEV